MRRTIRPRAALALAVLSACASSPHVALSAPSPSATGAERVAAYGRLRGLRQAETVVTDASGEGFSKRLGSLSLRELRQSGFEAMAVSLMAALTGTSLPVEPYPDLEAVAAALDLSMISHGPARFDATELESLNARLLHTMPFEAARPRLRPFGLEEERLWLALRGNLRRFGDITALARLVKGPVAPKIAAEDRGYIDEARKLLPPAPWNDGVFSQWIEALKPASGRKGRALFEPLRLALTGVDDGPDLKALLPLIGREEALRRLGGS